MRELAAILGAVLLLTLGVAAEASATKNSLGEDRRALNIYGVELSRVYEERYSEPLEWTIERCLPHGEDRRRVSFLLCEVDTPNSYFYAVATNWRNRVPREYGLEARYGPIDIYATAVKQG